MKIFCVDLYNSDKPQFYNKLETSQIRNNEPIFIPLFCEELRYEFAFAVKVNRVAKSIGKKFASRCWDELGVVVNFWAEDLAVSQREKGQFPDIAYSFDRSFALPNDFLSTDLLRDKNNISAVACVNGEKIISLEWDDIKDQIDEVISYISSYMTFKIGDVVMIKNSNRENFLAKIGDKIELKIGNEVIVETLIK